MKSSLLSGVDIGGDDTITLQKSSASINNVNVFNLQQRALSIYSTNSEIIDSNFT